MFRPQIIESAKIEDRSKEEVRASLVIFAITCALIRYVPILMRKISS
ncbi:hypothetical protein KR054_010687 [Drosophila jambulina]|nr:hypothetical protein KR054_010687 [Drosophila jambulina]